jgi:hypothetical protein
MTSRSDSLRSGSAFKHGILEEDIQHAGRSAMAVDELDDDLCLYRARGGSAHEGIVLRNRADVRQQWHCISE